jgi:pimeloyl-ACP methyl ester carboxylesterase
VSVTTRKRIRAGAALLGALVLVASVGYLGSSYAIADEFTRAERHAVDRAPNIPAATSYEDVSLRTVDGLRLSGWFFPTPGDRAAIVVHGRHSNRLEGGKAEPIADALLRSGFSVLLFDLRGHGNSDGERFSLGLFERWDVAAAIDYVVGRGFLENRIALIGVSMGAGTVIQELLIHPNVGAVVADSPYADVPVLVGEDLELIAHVPSWLTPGTLLMSKIAFGLDADQIRPIDVVRAHPERAFLFIHCDTDELIAQHHAHELRAASANRQTELWIATGCQHAWAFNVHPEEWKAHVLAFLNAQMPASAAAFRRTPER